MEIFSIYDIKARTYNQPFYFDTRELAKRAFVSLGLDPATTIGQHPLDFTLFHVGTWMPESCEFFPSMPTAEMTGDELQAALLEHRRIHALHTENSNEETH